MKKWRVLLLGVGMAACSPAAEEKAVNLSSPPTESVKGMRKALMQDDLARLPLPINSPGTAEAAADESRVRDQIWKAGLFAVRVRGEKLSWRPSYDGVKSFLERPDGEPSGGERSGREPSGLSKYHSFARQICATEMLVRTDLLDDRSEEATDALISCLQMLKAERNTSPVLFYYGLKRLQGHWPTDSINQMASAGIDGGNRWIEVNKKAIVDLTKLIEQHGSSPVATEVLSGYEEGQLIALEFIRRLNLLAD